MQTEIKLIPEVYCTKTYTIDISQRTIMGGIPNENCVFIRIKKNLQRKNKKGYIYLLEIEERKQYNTQGIRGLENDLAPLLQRIELQTNFEGEITKILNLYEIKTPWFWGSLRSQFLKQHKDKKTIYAIAEEVDTILGSHALFLENFKQSEIATLLFPPIYNKSITVGKHYTQEKEFSDFFGDIALPLQLSTTLKEYQKPPEADYQFRISQQNNTPNKGKAKVVRTGIIHPTLFNEQAASRYFKDLTDNYKLITNITAKYLETYDIDQNHHVDYAGQLLSVDIKNLFSFNQIVRVRPVPTPVTTKI